MHLNPGKNWVYNEGVRLTSPFTNTDKHTNIICVSSKFDQSLNGIVSIPVGQFGFKPGVGTTGAIVVNMTMCEKG